MVSPESGYINYNVKLAWHKSKRQKTLEERGLDFADAAEIFDGVTYTFPDKRQDYNEREIKKYQDLFLG
jgi:uncharacterized protein